MSQNPSKYKPYPCTNNPNPRPNPNKNELKVKSAKAKAHPTKRDVYVAFNNKQISTIDRTGLDSCDSHPTKLRNERVQSVYSDRINARLQMAPNQNRPGSTHHRPKSINSPPSGRSSHDSRRSIDFSALFNTNSGSSNNPNRTWQKSGSTSSLDNILTNYNHIQSQNDYDFDEDSNFQDFTGSYSDSEIITLEEVANPGLSDEATANGLSLQLQKTLVTDQTRNQQSKVNESAKSGQFDNLKNALNEIEISSSPNGQWQNENGNQYQIQLSDQDFYQTIPQKEFIPSFPDQQPGNELRDGAHHETFKNERIEIIDSNPAQIIRSSNKVFKAPLPPTVSLPKTASKFSTSSNQIKSPPVNQLVIHQTDSSGLSKGQSKLVDEAYDDTGTWAEFKEYSTPQPVDFILVAATSPSTKVTEESLTYLNQGQSYGIRMNRRPDEFQKANIPLNTPLRVQLRVVFHDRRLQNTEEEQLKKWSKDRRGERFLEIASDLSENISDITKSEELNCAEFSWTIKQEETAIVFVVLNCISTEFTQRRHGGERGAPFRIQADIFKEGETSYTSSNCIQAVSCQVRVFKPRGADRKLRTDQQKIEKKIDNPHEKNKFSISYTRTRLMPSVPWEPRQQVNNSKAENDQFRQERMEDYPLEHKFDIGTMDLEPKHVMSPADSTNSYNPSPASSATLQLVPTTGPTSVSSSLFITENSTVSFVQQWLRLKKFHNFQSKFANFSGQDMLILQRDDFIQIGQEGPGYPNPIAECIRLYNAVRSSKTTEASNNLVLYVRLPDEDNNDCYYPLFLKEKSVIALKHELAIKMNIDPNTVEKILNKRKTTFSPGINVMVTDEMVASIKSESSYKVSVSSSTSSSDGIIVTIQQTGV